MIWTDITTEQITVIGILLIDNGIDLLIGLSQFARLARVLSNAIIKAVDIGNAQFDKTAEDLIHTTGIKRPVGRIHRVNKIGRGRLRHNRY